MMTSITTQSEAEIPLAALSRLNHHARSHGGYGQRRAIYAYKTLAALTLGLDGKLSVRFIRWTGKCSRCENGLFSHWSWDDGYTVRCRDCGGTGQRTLRFLETILPNGTSWHHPWLSSGLDIARATVDFIFDGDQDRTGQGDLIEWQDPGEWRPMLPADPLSLEELVSYLNEVEDWVAAKPDRPRRADFWWKWEDAKRHLRQRKHANIFGDPEHGYMLDLGRAPGGCFVCGDESDLDSVTFGRVTPLFHWSLPVCKTHRQSPHPKDPPPAAMITPAIRRWLDRHEQVGVSA